MKVFIYVITIMLLTMVVVIINHHKDKTLHVELADMLYRKCASAVLDYLNINDTASVVEIKKCISGITASVFWSREKLSVTMPDEFAETVVSNLVMQGYLKESESINEKLYKLK